MHRVSLTLLTIAAALVFAPGAHAAGWVTTGPLSPANRTVEDGQVALLPDGGRVVAWGQIGADFQTRENVSVRIAPRDGDFGPTQVIDARSSGLRLAVGNDGTVALAWTDFVTRTLHIARRAPGEALFTEAQPVQPPGDEFPFGIDLEVHGGDVFAAYSSFKQGGSSSVWAARLPAAGRVVQLISGGPVDRAAALPDGVASATLAVDGNRIAFAWERTVSRNAPGQSTSSLLFASANGAGAFSAPQQLQLQADNSTFPPRAVPVVLVGGGRTYVVWEDERANLVSFQDRANPGRVLTFGAAELRGDFRARVDGSGALVTAWEAETPNSDNASIATARVPADGVPAAITRVTPPGVNRGLEALEVAPDGTALVLANGGPNGFATTFTLDAVLQPAGGVFGPTEAVSGLQDIGRNSFTPTSAALDPDGRALAAWSAADHSGSVNERLFLSERDTTPPGFGALEVPPTATVGQPVALAADATDALSAADVTWDLGDGSEAKGARVSHVYGRAGAATVTVSATDSVGNVTTQTRVIAVAPVVRAAGPSGGPGPAAADRVKPAVSRVSVTNRRFRVGTRATAAIAGRKRAPAGTALRLTVSERSTLAIAISSKAKKKTVVHGTLVRAGAGPGNVTIAFSGRLGRTALRPGSYTATVTAIDGAGNRSKAARVKFTVVKK
jgi:hypothetical protein